LESSYFVVFEKNILIIDCYKTICGKTNISVSKSTYLEQRSFMSSVTYVRFIFFFLN